MMHDSDIEAAIYLEHHGSLAAMLATLREYGLLADEVNQLARQTAMDWSRAARCITAERERAGVPVCDPDLHSRVVLERYQNQQLAPGVARNAWSPRHESFHLAHAMRDDFLA
jgi:hypothetical protein